MYKRNINFFSFMRCGFPLYMVVLFPVIVIMFHALSEVISGLRLKEIFSKFVNDANNLVYKLLKGIFKFLRVNFN